MSPIGPQSGGFVSYNNPPPPQNYHDKLERIAVALERIVLILPSLRPPPATYSPPIFGAPYQSPAPYAPYQVTCHSHDWEPSSYHSPDYLVT